MKICNTKNRKGIKSACGKLKPLSEFYDVSNGPSGKDNLCKDCRRAIKTKYNQSPKGQETQKRIHSLPKYRKMRKMYRRAHKLERNIRQKKRFETDVIYRLRHSIRTRTNNFLRNKGVVKKSKMVSMIGCSWSELKSHLERQFLPGMTWKNHGKWHIDHMHPLTAFNLANANEYKKAFSYKNLQPLWASDNIRKKNKILEVADKKPRR